MVDVLWKACLDDEAQDIVEYAVMLAIFSNPPIVTAPPPVKNGGFVSGSKS